MREGLNLAYPGMVYLVGAGPGDPELLTVKAKRLIEDADVILYDYLVHPSLLSTTKAVLVCVGKKKGKHSKKQSEIHDLLKHYAEQGHRVVRLKGGDPMVFGRVGEEMQFLQNNDIAYTVVPGVSSALAVPAYAGIPVTHRELSRSVAFVTGTLSTGGPTLDHHIPEADTLVILMSVTHLGTIVDKLLLQSRFSSETPVALIYSGTTSDQKCLMGTLSTIEEKQRQVQFKSPSLLIVGEVVPLSDTLN